MFQNCDQRATVTFFLNAIDITLSNLCIAGKIWIFIKVPLWCIFQLFSQSFVLFVTLIVLSVFQFNILARKSEITPQMTWGCLDRVFEDTWEFQDVRWSIYRLRTLPPPSWWSYRTAVPSTSVPSAIQWEKNQYIWVSERAESTMKIL